MSEPDCPWCSRPLIPVEPPPPPFTQYAEVVIYRCPKCVEEVPFWGDVIETSKHWMRTAPGEILNLPPDVPRVVS